MFSKRPPDPLRVPCRAASYVCVGCSRGRHRKIRQEEKHGQSVETPVAPLLLRGRGSHGCGQQIAETEGLDGRLFSMAVPYPIDRSIDKAAVSWNQPSKNAGNKCSEETQTNERWKFNRKNVAEPEPVRLDVDFVGLTGLNCPPFNDVGFGVWYYSSSHLHRQLEIEKTGRPNTGFHDRYLHSPFEMSCSAGELLRYLSRPRSPTFSKYILSTEEIHSGWLPHSPLSCSSLRGESKTGFSPSAPRCLRRCSPSPPAAPPR